MIFAFMGFEEFAKVVFYGFCFFCFLIWLAWKRLVQVMKSNPEARDRLLEKGWNIAKEHLRRKYGG